MPIRTVIFDCDGVLFDSRAANREYYSTLARDFGREALTPEEEDFVHVHTVFESVALIFRETPEVVEEAHRVRAARGYGPFFTLLVPEPGIYECLDSLKESYVLAVLTNRSDTIGEVLRIHRMDHYFQKVVSCLDVTRPKPDPEGVRLILNATDTEPGQAVYVGDAETDAATAKAGGIHFVGYKNPGLPADAHIDHFDQLVRAVKSL